MKNSKALWIIVALLAIIVAFFIANAISQEQAKSNRQSELISELEQSQNEMSDGVYEELTN